MSHQKKLYNREDARRMANTMVGIRREQGEDLPVTKALVNKMKSLPANVLAQYAAKPKAFRRNIELVSVKPGCVTLRMGGAR